MITFEGSSGVISLRFSTRLPFLLHSGVHLEVFTLLIGKYCLWTVALSDTTRMQLESIRRSSVIEYTMRKSHRISRQIANGGWLSLCQVRSKKRLKRYFSIFAIRIYSAERWPANQALHRTLDSAGERERYA